MSTLSGLRRPLHLGLTGGIGSGKSTVARMLVDFGAFLVDADAISRQTTAAGGAAIAQIAAVFGPDALTSDGAMNRDRMRQWVFADSLLRQKLENIIHPLVSKETAHQAELAARAGAVCIVFDVPLLVESGRWRQMLDQVLVVDCDESTQISRVLSREIARTGSAGQWTVETVQKVIQGQASRSYRLKAADMCICNDGLSLTALETLVKQISIRFGL